MEVLSYDVRQLNHPEPLEIMTKALQKAQNGALLEMIHRREPFPLYDMIKAQNLDFFVTCEKNAENEIYHIFIAKKEVLQEYLESLK